MTVWSKAGADIKRNVSFVKSTKRGPSEEKVACPSRASRNQALKVAKGETEHPKSTSSPMPV